MHPGTSTAVARRDLAGLVESFDLEMDRRGFVGNRVLPIFGVPLNGGRFPKIKIEELLRYNVAVDRAPQSGYNRDTTKFIDDSYTTNERGAEELVDDKLKNIYSSYFDMEAIATKKAIDRVLRAQESRVSSAIFNTTTFTGSTLYLDVSASRPWTTPGTATPVAEVNTAKRNVRTNFGKWPNTIIFNYNNLLYLRECADIQERIASSGAGSSIKASEIVASQLAQVFDLETVLIPNALTNTAAEGAAAVLSDMWSSSYAWVGYVARTNDISEPCIGRTMHWDGDGSTPLGTIETYRNEVERGDVVRVRHEVEEKMLFSSAGFLIKIAA